MYTFAYDREAGLLVGIWSGRSNTPAHHDACLASISTADNDGVGRKEKVVTVLISDPECPAPSAVERKRITEMWGAGRAAHAFALVTESRIARGVMTAVSWFAPSTSTRPQSAHATFEEALKWVEERRPGVGRRFRELRDEARALANTPMGRQA